MTKKVPTCPECGSTKTWKDGTRLTEQGKIQRYCCRECGYRFSKRMERLARLTNNTRYRKIHFHTFRHVFALRTYHRTKDILHVKTLLGHRNLMTTQRYVELYCQIYDTNQPDQFITKIAATKEERINLINDGWTFIKNDENDWYFRKPK
jgi:integrase